MRRSLILSVLLGIASWSGIAQALEFRAIGASPVILYDAPSTKGGKVYVAPRGMPVEVILTYGTWSKVRDMGGDLSWVESKELVARRNVVVRVANVKAHSAADEASPMVFSADKNVLLEMAEPVSSGWVKVKHRDGQIGYVKVSEVWGV
ncbi:SH3 domain-containing protein [Undibacterium sp. RTI2.1]|uniref:SH3 domain-containing protein n=2 Tax=Pseudomonadota TaxID=1224 RepID=UPI002AB5D77D|nr:MULTISPECIES: SH3 domain-containing protein [unclassified Undibacterium]MDY7540032.1 SH3 domain-containing protein [Undibacterium sp. 5I1]MEB0031572.1 SH3 domain-containing protein [Undibacterium sp. RTI2.1]MEB0117858.1 SH3 domain-containing protein [Undibacterium sp. RTI2.2]MEB0232462.1 SH3 domain-containing protein [Undibacterium sp. 10I3]MEB0257879.1 SH3 domain-containing protein [Undibacterium sp. 5I1]